MKKYSIRDQFLIANKFNPETICLKTSCTSQISAAYY